jgi:predicted short-subunit dehydrogenase-like oxidoreductase (DUF2520 family)
MKLKLGIVGTGNVAWHLSKKFIESGLNLTRLYGRQSRKPETFAHMKESVYRVLSDDVPDVDVLILAVQDGAVSELAQRFKRFDGIICHTSGTVNLQALQSEDYSSRAGIFYPLYSFKMGKELDWRRIPILLEAESQEVLHVLMELAKALGAVATTASSEARAHYHVAAVFANNYTNYMYDLAESYLSAKGLELDVLFPIIRQTAERISQETPKQVQTGPALRNDLRTLKKHEDALKEFPEMLKVYQFLADCIKERHS